MCDIRATHRLVFRKKVQLDKYLIQYGLERATGSVCNFRNAKWLIRNSIEKCGLIKEYCVIKEYCAIMSYQVLLRAVWLLKYAI